MHISFKIITFYFTLCCSTCFGHHCVYHQEFLIAAHAVSGHRVVLGQLFPPALFCCYCTGSVVSSSLVLFLLYWVSCFLQPWFGFTVLGQLLPPALICCYCTGSVVSSSLVLLLLYWVSWFLHPCSVFTEITTEQGWRKHMTQHHTVTRDCMCSNKKLLMMDTMVSETCRAA
jgi:hypothetical protein